MPIQAFKHALSCRLWLWLGTNRGRRRAARQRLASAPKMAYFTNLKSHNNKNYAAFSNHGIVLGFSVINPERRMNAINRTWGRSGLLLERPCCTRTNTRHMTSASLIAVRFLPSLFLCGLVTFASAVLCGYGRSLLALAISHTDLPLWVWVLRALHISVGCGVGYATFDYAAFDYATFDYAGGAV